MYDQLVDLLRRDMKPALGVTEVGAIALAAARANSVVAGEIVGVEVTVNGGLYKNAFSCAIPSTKSTGNAMAAAIGAVAGDWEQGLEVLKEIGPKDVQAAQELLNLGAVNVSVDETKTEIYVCAKVRKKKGVGMAVIEKYHNRFTLVKNGDETLFEDATEEEGDVDFDFDSLSIAQLVDFAQNVPFQQIAFLKDMLDMNERLSEAGAKGMGLEVSKTLQAFDEPQTGKGDIIYAAQQLTCDALDARLCGYPLPAMSIAGSGSHGIVCSLPVLAYGRGKRCTEEQILRALALSCLVTIYSKHYTGRLSPLCGCVLGGGSGAASGIVLLMGGGVREVSGAINHMAANLTGMICDGGSIGCALKGATGVYSIFLAAMLSMQGRFMPPHFGILGSTAEQTIKNIGRISTKGMGNTDSVTISIMQSGK